MTIMCSCLMIIWPHLHVRRVHKRSHFVLMCIDLFDYDLASVLFEKSADFSVVVTLTKLSSINKV